MTSSAPLVQEMRNRFDHFDETNGDRTRTSSIKVTSNQHGYSVTSYPAGTYGFEGFTADVHAPQGVFGEHGPTRVEVSREKDGMRRFTLGDTATDDNGMTAANITLEPQAAREGLILPGDTGFELFDQLHTELAVRRAVVADVLGTIGISANPVDLKYTSQTISVGHYDHEDHIATHKRETLIEVGGIDAAAKDYVRAHIKLDGSLTAPMQKGQRTEFPPEDPMVFRAGTAEADWKYSHRHERPPIGDEALLAFAGLHASFSALYK